MKNTCHSRLITLLRQLSITVHTLDILCLFHRASPLRSSRSSGPSPAFFCLLCYLFFFFFFLFLGLFLLIDSFSFHLFQFVVLFLCTFSFKPDNTGRQTDFWLMPAFLFRREVSFSRAGQECHSSYRFVLL